MGGLPGTRNISFRFLIGATPRNSRENNSVVDSSLSAEVLRKDWIETLLRKTRRSFYSRSVWWDVSSSTRVSSYFTY